MSEDLNKAKKFFFESLDLQFNGNLDAAKNSLEKALHFAPSRKSIINNLLVIYFTLKDTIGLNKIIQHTQKLDDKLSYLTNLAEGYRYFIEKDYLNSIHISKKLLNLNHIEIKGHCYDLLIKNYFKTCDLKNLFFYLRLALKLKINHEQNLYNVGSILQYLSKPRAAIYFINKSLNIKNNYTYHSCLAQSYLKIKNFDKGLYYWEQRLLNKKTISRDVIDSVNSIKSISDLKNKKILVVHEQGLGDTIHFSRYIKKLIGYGGDISFQIQDKLFNLFDQFDNKVNLIKFDDIKNQHYDYKIPLVSLLKIYGQNYNNIFYDKLLIKNVEPTILLDSLKTNIAFAFQGNSEYICDQFRSISYENYKSIFNQTNVIFHNLAKPYIKEFKSYDQIKDASQLNFLEMANFLKRMDIVISTDTVFAHLCGTLNINCIMLLNKNSEWRWFNDHKKTIWYPSIRILKQKVLNNWQREIDIIKRYIKLKSNYKL